MKKKEEISIREQVSNAINKGRTAFNNWKSFNPSVEGMYSEDKFIIDKLELYLTDQIKSMEGDAVEFAEWIRDNKWSGFLLDSWVKIDGNGNQVDICRTPQELYELFKSTPSQINN